MQDDECEIVACYIAAISYRLQCVDNTPNVCTFDFLFAFLFTSQILFQFKQIPLYSTSL